MNDSSGEEVQQMCNLSEGIEQKGIEKGIQQGIQQGILAGYQSLHHLMQAKAITRDQALDDVENKDEFQKWLSLQNNDPTEGRFHNGVSFYTKKEPGSFRDNFHFSYDSYSFCKY